MRHRSVLTLLAALFCALLLTGPAGATPETGVVNINEATPQQLTFLPGIGPSRAERIVAYRSKQPFKRIVELARVKGIGLKTVRKLKAHLSVEGPTTLTGRIKSPRPKTGGSAG